MDEKDIENIVEQQDFSQEENNNQEKEISSFNSQAMISDGLEEFAGLLDDEPPAQIQEEIAPEEVIEQAPEVEEEISLAQEDMPEDDFSQEEFEKLQEETTEEIEYANEIPQKVIEPSEEFEKSGFAEIFDNDSLNDENSKKYSKKEEVNIEPQDVKMSSDIMPDTSCEFEEEQEYPEELITVRPVKFQQFQDTPPIRAIKKNLDIMHDVSMHVSVELGRTKSSIKDVMELEEGSIVELDKIAGEQVEIYVNDKLVAKGEVIVIEDKFGVRVTSTNVNIS